MAGTEELDRSDRLLDAITRAAEQDDVTPGELRELAEAYAWIMDTGQPH